MLNVLEQEQQQLKIKGVFAFGGVTICLGMKLGGDNFVVRNWGGDKS